MKRLTIIAILILAAGGARATAGEAENKALLARAAADVAAAADPNAAFAAYTAGAAIDRNDLALNRAIVRRMVDLGVPDAAYPQAMLVVARDSEDGLAWAVIAYSQAAAGHVGEALSDMVAAVNDAPKEPFVLSTAGQLTAWLDQNPADPSVPAYVKDAVNELAGKLAKDPIFAAARQDAAKAYAELAAAQKQAPAAPADSAAPWTTDEPLPEATAVAPAGEGTPRESAPVDFGAAGPIEEAFLPADAPLPDDATLISQSTLVSTWEEDIPAEAYAQAQYVEPYYSQPQTVYVDNSVNVVNVINIYPAPVYIEEGCWRPDLVVFLGDFRRHGLLIGRLGRRDVVIDRARNVFLGDARGAFFGHDRNHVVIHGARRVERGLDHALITSRTPRALLADNQGTILRSRIERPAPIAPALARGMKHSGPPATPFAAVRPLEMGRPAARSPAIAGSVAGGFRPATETPRALAPASAIRPSAFSLSKESHPIAASKLPATDEFRAGPRAAFGPSAAALGTPAAPAFRAPADAQPSVARQLPAAAPNPILKGRAAELSAARAQTFDRGAETRTFAPAGEARSFPRGAEERTFTPPAAPIVTRSAPIRESSFSESASPAVRPASPAFRSAETPSAGRFGSFSASPSPARVDSYPAVRFESSSPIRAVASVQAPPVRTERFSPAHVDLAPAASRFTPPARVEAPTVMRSESPPVVRSEAPAVRYSASPSLRTPGHVDSPPTASRFTPPARVESSLPARVSPPSSARFSASPVMNSSAAPNPDSRSDYSDRGGRRR